MGGCQSSEIVEFSTAKLISHDGTLKEFLHPVKVSYVLQKNIDCFICDSDHMEFDEFISAIDSNEELRLGQLYFLLPLSRLSRPLQAEEMAELAMKASEALMKSNYRGGKSIFNLDDKKRFAETGNVTKNDGEPQQSRRRSERYCKDRGFMSQLSIIPE